MKKNSQKLPRIGRSKMISKTTVKETSKNSRVLLKCQDGETLIAAGGERRVTIGGQWCQQHSILRSNKDQEIREQREHKSVTFLDGENNNDNKDRIHGPQTCTRRFSGRVFWWR